MSTDGEMSCQAVPPTVVRKTWPRWPAPAPLKPPSTAYTTVGSFGSNAARCTLREGRLRVMSVKTTPLGAPTVAARALVDTKTRPPTDVTTLSPRDGATDGLPAPGKAPTIRQLVPPFRLCHRFWLPLT